MEKTHIEYTNVEISERISHIFYKNKINERNNVLL